MTDRIKNKLDSWSSMIKFVTPVGVLLILALQTKFATRGEIQQIQAEIVKINTSITLLLDWSSRNDEQDKRMGEIEDKQQKMEIDLAKLL